mmetsp:Transcript_29395/g.63270  ORF Transcript_29395/g.63270 Transcript_29395/m.63270 type:complete len:148 (+) Transcript_29395:85-528(+)
MPLPYQFTFLASGIQLSPTFITTHYIYSDPRSRNCANCITAKHANIPPETTPVSTFLPTEVATLEPTTCPAFIMEYDATKAVIPAVVASTPAAPPAAPPAKLLRVIGSAIRMASPLPTMPDWIPSVDKTTTRRHYRHVVVVVVVAMK